MTTQRSVVVGVFHDRSQAQQAIRELRQAGFQEDQLSVVTRHDKEEAATAQPAGTKAAEGAGIGVATGASVGALWALGIASNVLPGIGPVLFGGGLLASLLASAATGAAVAGLAGALIGLGIPEKEARYYEAEVKAGRTVVTVRANGRAAEAWTILERNAAYNAPA